MPTTPPLIPRKPVVTLVGSPDDTPVFVDLSCYVSAVDWGQEVEEIDTSTFCQPSSTELGKVTDTVVLEINWSPAAYTALLAYVGEEVELQVFYNDADVEAAWARVRFGAVPLGRIEPGTVNEVELPAAVLTSPVYDSGFTAAP